MTNLARAQQPPANGMTFGSAIEALKKSLRVARVGWNPKGTCHAWLELQQPDAHSKMTMPYIYLNLNYPEDMKTKTSSRAPWVPSHFEMLAEDWSIVE
jgi:hypothetical protein